MIRERDAQVNRKRPPARTSAANEEMVEPDLQRAVDLVTQLMAIPGKSGEEAAVANFITSQLRRAGARAGAIHTDAAHLRTPLRGDTGNLFFQLPGTRRAPRRLLMAHMDTVPLCVGSQPERRGKWIRSSNARSGLGADDRAGVAVVLHTALEILRHDLPHPPLTFFWTIQEETGLHGARVARRGLLGHPTLAFNWDGGAPNKLTIGATGGYRLSIHIAGLASHAGGAPAQGISAIVIAAQAIAQLQRDGWHGAISKAGRVGTSNVGVIQGGDATNVVPDSVHVRAEARSHDARFRKRIVAEIEKAFRHAARSVRNDQGKSGTVKIEGRLDYNSFCLRSDEPGVAAAQAAISSLGLKPELAVANGGVDANWMFAHGIPTVTLGCGQRNQHTLRERLYVPEFENSCRIALRLATAAR